MSQDKPKHDDLEGAPFRFAIVKAGYNGKLVEALYQQVCQTLLAKRVLPDHIKTWSVPGSGEIPYLVNLAAITQEYDCIIGLGVVIAGDTPHHEIIAHSTAKAMQDIGLQTQVPVINGIVVTNNLQQAEVRCLGPQARGHEFAEAALVMAQHQLKFQEHLDDLGLSRDSAEDSFEQN